MNGRRFVFAFTSIALGSLAACQSEAAEAADEQAELAALLRDEPLMQVPPGATASIGSDSVHSHVVLPTSNPAGVWNFDDCSPFRTNLSDAGPENNTAFRSVGVACTDGIEASRAVAIAAPEDIVYVPDQPNFTFESGVTVAGWFKPATSSGTRTLFRKRDKHYSSFALLLHGHKLQFVVNLGDGRAISIVAPHSARVGVFQHVAATYDGTTARLYVDGIEVNQLAASGTVPPGPGPLLIGNDGSERRFSGAIDSALFATHALTASEVLALLCFPHTPTMAVTPTAVTTPPGEATTIDIALTNHNPAACAPIRFDLTTLDAGSQITLFPQPGNTTDGGPVASGATSHMTITATPSVLTGDGAAFDLQFRVTEPITGFDALGTAQLTVAEPAGCHVSTARELMIKLALVVDDPVRTVFDPASSDPRNGVWTFKHLMEDIAPTAADAPAMVEAMLTSFTTEQTINGLHVAPRPNITRLVLAQWPRTPEGALDLAQAPLRLQAIVNRLDLRNLGHGDAGEGRFVFAFTLPDVFPLDALVIFEYKLPATTDQDVLDWAQSFHALGTTPFGEDYNAALQAITERFVARGARPGHVNDSAINVVRTNEFAFRAAKHDPWELRQFELSAVSGRLEPAPVSLTPDASFNNTTTLAAYINANQAAILAETHTVPAVFAGQPFQAGAILNFIGAWAAPGVDPEARHHFALNTCNGCHSPSETGVQFSQLTPRFPGSEASLSRFLTGITIADPVTGQSRHFNDLARRNADLRAIVCAESPAGIARAQLRSGIQRVH